jgi:polar amino acid transport system permease protein
MRHVLQSQAIRIMAPSFINQWVSLVYLILCTSLDALATRLLPGRAQGTEPRVTAPPAVIVPSPD